MSFVSEDRIETDDAVIEVRKIDDGNEVHAILTVKQEGYGTVNVHLNNIKRDDLAMALTE